VPQRQYADLRRFRRKLGLSQKSLAELLTVDEMTVWKWEKGTHTPPPFLWRALRDIERDMTDCADWEEAQAAEK
jgi:DNA-binding transcriptional regulator YiaG